MTKSRTSKQYRAFRELTDRLLAVPRAVVEERIKQHRERVAATPNKLKPGRNKKAKDG